MNLFFKLLYFLQGEMNEPKPFGWFHLMWIISAILILIVLYKTKSEKKLKLILGIYGLTALILEILKQLIWSFNYENGIITWDYQWYAFPFQLCTTPIYISILCLFLKESKIRNALLSYMAYITILGSFMTAILPSSCFTSDILVNIHTMWLHFGSLVVSIYLLMKNIVKIDKNNLKNAFIVFIGFVIFASFLNIFIYNIGILNGEEFNMFYISPYFISSLSVYDIIQQNVPYIIYLLLHILSIFIGSLIIYFIFYTTKKVIYENIRNKEIN